MTNQIRLLLLLVATSVCSAHYGQDRGLNPYTPKKDTELTGTTYAVVVAISDYTSYKKLDFAHRDGQAFADWLVSRGGEIKDKKNLKVLIDKDATFSSVVNTFDWLNSKCKDGDRAFIYFAGHGDVESKSASEPGYLLCYDSPQRLFAGGGAIPLNYLQEIITTLSMKNTKVVVVLDACHAGKLAGDVVNGRQRAAENMIYYVPDPNVVKILSCKADQNSREDATLGGGRGVFSYFLVNGLGGLADVNLNNKVSISELERYLEDNVMAVTSPLLQEPLVKYAGSKADVIVDVNSFYRDSLKSEYENRSKVFAILNPRTLTKELVGKDTVAAPEYKRFNECLEQKRYFEPEDDCAEHYFNKIMSMAVSDDFRQELIRKYAVSLQEKAQLVINNFIENKVEELSKSTVNKLEEYKDLPRYLDRAADLLGKEHYFYKDLKSNQYLFEGILMYILNQRVFNDNAIRKNIELYRKSLEYNERNPLTLFYLSNIYAAKKHDRDSCEYFYNRLIDVSTSWVMAYAQHAYNLSYYFKDYETAKNTILEGWAIDSSNVYLVKSYGSLYYFQKDYQNAIKLFSKAVMIDSTDAITWVNLAVCYTQTGDDQQAIKHFEKSLEIDSVLITSYMNFAGFYYLRKDYKNAEKLYLKVISLRPEYIPVKGLLCRIYLAQNDLDKVEQQLKAIEMINQDDWRYYLYNASLYAIRGKDEEALTLLRKAFMQDGFNDLETLNKTTYFDNLKKDGRFTKLYNEFFTK